GYALTLVARDLARLEELAATLHAEHGTACEVISADLADPAALAGVEERVRQAEDLSLLVNCAGFGTTGRFAELDIDAEEAEVRVNVIATMRLARAALPGMIARGQGGLINVSSIAAFQPGPLNATYSATKSFVISFSEALHEELRGTGVTVQALCPGFTRTEFQHRAGWEPSAVPGFAWSEAPDVVRVSLRALKRGDAVCIPGVHNKLLAATSGAAPRGLVRRVSGIVSRRAVR
ncbi:MAG: SDR family NAD(P)-dependent oxidoreductase, partial [Hyphomicrobiales bacterium]